MIKPSINDLLKRDDFTELHENSGNADRGNIDKSGHCYHVITRAWGKENIFTREIAQYRHDLLRSLCSAKGVVILFSVTMPNHTHEVLLVPDGNLLMNTYMVLDRTIVRMIRLRNPKKYRSGVRVLRRYPVYVALKDIVTLFYEGKYVYDNPAHLRREGKYVPYSCFWMFEKNYFPSPYDESVYRKLFGMSAKDLYGIYTTMTAPQVLEYARHRFSNWTPEKNDALFSCKPRSPSGSPS